MQRVILVGDIHGCFDELRALLDSVAMGPADRLISVGDLVGKGPAGARVVRFFREGGHEAVRGNHDEKLLAYRRGERDDLRDTHRADADALDDADWAWLGALPLHLPLPEHEAVVVHAGLVPGVPLEAQRPADAMNMRSLRDDGSASSRFEDGAPWASLWPGPELAVFGHDAMRGLQMWPHAFGLDTGCVYGGELTALVLPERRLVSVPALRDYVGVR